MHNVYWRVDLDIGTPANNAVDGITQSQNLTASPESGCASGTPFDPGTCYRNDYTRMLTEQVDFFSPFNSWHVINKSMLNRNERPIGYEIVPGNQQSWSGMSLSREPWSSGDFFVTEYNGCELLAFDNAPPYIPAGCAGANENVDTMAARANPIDGADIVVWPVQRFQHLVRDEDQLNMLIESVSVTLQPRGWREKNTLEP
jgi:Cu2+-containing amine oxidase